MEDRGRKKFFSPSTLFILAMNFVFEMLSADCGWP